MIHLVFNEADMKPLSTAMELDESLQGDLLLIQDDYSVGPIENIYTESGLQDRANWWASVLTNSDFENKLNTQGETDDALMKKIQDRLKNDSEEKIWIWAAQNKHDVCGYYWLLSYVKEFQGRAFILYLNNLPFINATGNIFYPTWLHQIPAKEFIKAKKLAREITPSEFEIDPDEWAKLCTENKGVRLLEGAKKLIQADYDFYDSELKKYITHDWQKASKILSHFLNKSKETTSEPYLLWRLKTMINMDMFDVQGNLKRSKEFELKQKS
ncbi:MAG: DUF1835 domain-containing protein [Niastella sp.]|nr:DUF1835 domain-containing protein [Niastella sp.]